MRGNLMQTQNVTNVPITVAQMGEGLIELRRDLIILLVTRRRERAAHRARCPTFPAALR